MIQLRLYTRVQGPRTQPLSSLSHLQLDRRFCRSFVHASNPRNRNISADPKPLTQEIPPTGSPESLPSRAIPDVTIAKSNGEPQAPALLAEQTLSNREQRKADWAIMKEMSRYLWPKVWEAGTKRYLSA